MSGMLRMDADQIRAFLELHFPQAARYGQVIHVRAGEVRIELAHDDGNLRPGGTISGPTMMALADTTAYYLVLAMVGPYELAVTSNLNIHFLRRPRPGSLFATARPLKIGRRLAVVETQITDAADDLIATASVTYALPDAAADDPARARR